MKLPLLLTVAATVASAEDPAPFPFVMPAADVAATVVSAGELGPAPLDENARIHVADGHYVDAAGKRVRLVGTSIVAGGNFPDPADAPAIAAHLRKYGFNCVRLHHMDAPWAKPNIFYLAGNSYGKPTRELDAQSLDRLDHLVAELGKQGVYVDVNLHVARGWVADDGFPDAEKLDGSGKIVGYFEPGMIERQRLYARQLLTHRNPYTGTTFAESPGVALVEIDNEDSLLGAVDALPGLPPHYVGLLTTGWNAFLTTKYGTDAKLLAAWNAAAKPLGPDLVSNGALADGTKGWVLEKHEATDAQLAAEEVAGQTNAPTGRALRIGGIKPDGTGWHLQLHQVGLDLKDGETYTLTFAARAAEARTIGVGSLLDRAPWTNLGLGASDRLTTDWRRYSHTFVAKGTQPGHDRISFVLGDNAAEVMIGDVRLRSGGGGVDLQAGQSLAAKNLELPTLGDNAVGRDYAEYLMKVESDYSQGMRTFLRDELKVRAPILCSQASYGGLGGVAREAALDAVDMHAYWQHPSFPRKAWDWNDFRTPNTPMVADRGGGTLHGLAMHRVAGKPFTVSEYDHPAPNDWAAECVPMIFAYAAYQDWDGVFLFNWEGHDSDRISSFFDQTHHPAKLAFMPTAARLFRGGLIATAPSSQTLVVPRAAIPAVVARRSEYAFWSVAVPEDKDQVGSWDMVTRLTAVRIEAGGGTPRIERVDSDGRAPGAPMLQWEHADPKQAVFIVDAPQVRELVGFLGGHSRELSGLTVEVAPSARGFAAVTLAALDGKNVRSSRSLLLTAIDKAENPGIEWDADRREPKHAWEKGPVQVWGVTAKLSLATDATAVEVYALDPTGARGAAVPAAIKDGKLSLAIDPSQHTVWYELALK